VLGAFVTAVYVLRATKTIFWGPKPEGEYAHLEDVKSTEWAAPLVLGALLVVFGFYPRVLLDFVDVATNTHLPRETVSLSLRSGERGRDEGRHLHHLQSDQPGSKLVRAEPLTRRCAPTSPRCSQGEVEEVTP
jgi:NADH:ubiquinone oxidoreductase subunit 5 (subunit L)/multisubunit Na+/H+ antiporter MnhA subunit